MLVFTPVGGVLGDRYHKGKIMFICDFLKGGMIILATVLMLLFKEPDVHIVILFVLGILGNIVSGIFNPASGALFPHIVKEEQLQQANSYFTIKSSLESIAGVILAGIMYAALQVHVLFFFVGICFVASGVSEMFIRYEHMPSPEKLTMKLAFRDMKEGVSYLRTKKALLALLAAILFINFFITPVTGNFIPYFVKTDLAAAPSYLLDSILTPELWYSALSVIIGISSLLGAVILSSRAQKEKCGFATAVKLCVFAVVMVAVTVCYYIFVERGTSINGFLITLCLGGFLMGFLLSYINIPINTAVMRTVERDKLSKVTSIISIGAQGMIPIASMLAGIILQGLGVTPLLAVCSAGFAVTAVLMLLSRHIREM
jgi:MFS family permease